MLRLVNSVPGNIEAPTKMPIAAITIITLKDAAFDPIAEFIKLTASLLTPTDRSNTASTKRKMIRKR